MGGFAQILDEVEERSRRLDDAPPPDVSFVEPPEPVAPQPRVVVTCVAAAYQKMQSTLSPGDHPASSIDERGEIQPG